MRNANTLIDYQKIESFAKRERWNARQIALATGISSNTVGNIFKGTTEPRASSLKRICDLIGLPIDQAFISAETSAESLN